MYNVLIDILPATSITLFFLIIVLLQRRRRKALERELSEYRNQAPPDPNEELALLKEEALKEIEELKNLERSRLDSELRLKRIENDAEITSKQASIDKILEDYKLSNSQVIENNLNEMKALAQLQYEEQKQTYEDKLFYIQGQLLIEESKIEQFRRNQEAITDALRRKALEDDEYNLHLGDADRLEVVDLQAIATRYPRIRPVILKAIYEIYYAPEVRKLVSRTIGSERVSGIYRITCKTDGRVYIGKSVDIGPRWVTHFKRAAGVETETTNLLYPAMRAIGIDKFSFEIIERGVAEDNLSTREKYWQLFYDAKTHGFSVK